jgi:hypothetical protein
MESRGSFKRQEKQGVQFVAVINEIGITPKTYHPPPTT